MMRTIVFLAIFSSFGTLIRSQATPTIAVDDEQFSAQSGFLKVAVSRRQPAFRKFSVDSLGHGDFGPNVLRQPVLAKTAWHASLTENGVEYRRNTDTPDEPVCWAFDFSEKKTIQLTSSWPHKSIGPDQHSPLSLLLDINRV